jgi:hypothetical protein
MYWGEIAQICARKHTIYYTSSVGGRGKHGRIRFVRALNMNTNSGTSNNGLCHRGPSKTRKTVDVCTENDERTDLYVWYRMR